ncbi:MAG TPA: YaiI/YqxD family protein [Parasulfuritortus sp.]
MKIWVDADACPAVIKDILFRAAERAQLPLTLIANKLLRVPPSPWIRALQVPQGFDVADRRIADETQAGDLVITADVPLAAQVIAKGAYVLDPRGEMLDAGNIAERLTMRNFMEGLRGSGVETGGPAAFSTADRQAFANRLDRLLAKRARETVSRP